MTRHHTPRATRRATANEKHAALVDAGWSTRVDGLLRSPDPRDLRAYRLAAAWDVHTEQQTTNQPPVATGRAGGRAHDAYPDARGRRGRRS